MREIRLSGSEGGGFELNRFSLPLSLDLATPPLGGLNQRPLEGSEYWQVSRQSASTWTRRAPGEALRGVEPE